MVVRAVVKQNSSETFCLCEFEMGEALHGRAHILTRSIRSSGRWRAPFDLRVRTGNCVKSFYTNSLCLDLEQLMNSINRCHNEPQFKTCYQKHFTRGLAEVTQSSTCQLELGLKR